MCDDNSKHIKEEKNKSDILWKRFIAGDDEAFYSIYNKYFDALYNYGIHFSVDAESIKDHIHDLFINLHKYRKRLSDTDNIHFYLCRSLRRLIHKEHSQRQSFLSDNELLLLNDIPVLAFEDTLIASEIRDRNSKILAEVMKELSDRQREGLNLKFEQNFSYKEIADIMGISVESARTCIYRALKDLREELEKKGISKIP